MKEKETEVILVSGGRRVAGANSKFKTEKSPEYLEKQLSWKVAPRKGIRIQESGKVLRVESGILGFGIRSTRQGIRNPTNDWYPESEFQ